MQNDDLLCLQTWYKSQCIGDWEHEYGIKFDTLDNPGRMIKVDLSQTQLQKKQFKEIDSTKNSNNWVQCNVENNQFQGFGGPLNLGDLIQTFNLWSKTLKCNKDYKKNANLIWLQKWYRSQCNGDWEHAYGITIETVDTPGWYVTVDLDDTCLENSIFEEIKEDQDDLNWFFCLKRSNKFEASCGPCNLNTIFQIFRQWVESRAEDKEK
ncbi:MAG: immunity 53 family protein [Chlamydiales bacterium]